MTFAAAYINNMVSFLQLTCDDDKRRRIYDRVATLQAEGYADDTALAIAAQAVDPHLPYLFKKYRHVVA